MESISKRKPTHLTRPGVSGDSRLSRRFYIRESDCQGPFGVELHLLMPGTRYSQAVWLPSDRLPFTRGRSPVQRCCAR